MNVTRVDASYLKTYNQKHLNTDQVIRFFLKDLDGILYIYKEQTKQTGILTLGDFLRAGCYSEDIVNFSFQSVCETEKKENIITRFEKRKNIHRIPIVDETGVCGEWRRELVERKGFEEDSIRYIISCKSKINNLSEALQNYFRYRSYDNVYILNHEHDRINEWIDIKNSFSNFYSIKEEEIFKLSSNDLLLVCDRRVITLAGIMKKKAMLVETLIEETCQLHLISRIIDKIRSLNLSVYYFRRPDKRYIPDTVFTQRQKNRLENKVSATNMLKDYNNYIEDFKDIFGELFNKEYIEGVLNIPPIVTKLGKTEHIDFSGNYVNVIGGARCTVKQPLKYDRQIYVYGRCGVFGYAVEDKDTVPSVIQNHLNENGDVSYRVNNSGLWGADEVSLFYNVLLTSYAPNDIIIFYMKLSEPAEDRIKEADWPIYDTSSWILENLDRVNFFEEVGHLNKEGYKILGKRIAETILENDRPSSDINEISTQDYNFTITDEQQRTFMEGLKKLKVKSAESEKIGAIVMNCNPFTLGHRYLIETAVKEVDYLYIFVVQEDKSEFSFNDRLSMVKEGVKDLKNVIVTGSGELILSSLTFPEYFEKDSMQEIKIDPTKDIDIFARVVAPILNITVRFVGEEPKDNVTRQYNEKMAELLPRYGINCKVVKRIMYKDEVISASTVRKKIKENDKEALNGYVPESTLKYLMRILP